MAAVGAGFESAHDGIGIGKTGAGDVSCGIGQASRFGLPEFGTGIDDDDAGLPGNRGKFFDADDWSRETGDVLCI